MRKPFYAIQPAFSGGEISEDVASRVDLDKYQLALLQAENMIIQPYGSVKKRSGSGYLGTTKNNGKAILRRFEYNAYLSYMLEIGREYIRIWKDGEYTEVELVTPYTEADLPYLRTVQSADVMYFCSGTKPVYKLTRLGDLSWTFAQVDWKLPAFADVNKDETLKITPSALEGTITLTASEDIFSADRVGDYIKLEQRVSGAMVSISASGSVTSSNLRCGESWKVITHGTWTGTVTVQISYDGGSTWKDLRSYTSKNDYNPTESGEVEELALLRVVATISSGTCNADLSAYPYTHIGYAEITAYTDAQTVTAKTIKPMGATTASADWSFGAWSVTNGYPYAVTFFQDRLCFGGCKDAPQRVWMSVTGDYENFEVEKEAGAVIDDSAISIDLLSQQCYAIVHMAAANDMIILTEGNTWTISGSEIVTPSTISPRNQESYGVNWVTPIKIGSRFVYVQRRGRTVRDVGYTYDTDSYVGIDLTLLAKHLVRNIQIVDGAYAQDPDSCIYYVTNDGKMLCFTYMPEQKVYAWSHFVTDGKYESVCAVASDREELTMVIVNRTIGGVTKRYIEYFMWDTHSESQMDYGMLDSFVFAENVNSAEITGLGHLEGKVVKVLADGYLYEDKEYKVTNGKITLPEEVETAIVGLPYKMILEQTNFDVGNTENGTIQGRKKRIVSAILRLNKSYGGSIGPDADHQNKIIYDPERLELGENILYSGDKEITTAIGGFNDHGRIYIIQDDPYPFHVSAIIRKVELDV